MRSKFKINDGKEEALDPSVAASSKCVKEEMMLVLRIALACTSRLPTDRPSMTDVVTMLGEAKPSSANIRDIKQY